CDIQSSTTFIENDPVEVSTGEQLGLCVELGEGSGEVSVRISTSFISHDQAGLNFAQELAGKQYDELMLDATQTWEDLLDTITIEGSSEEQAQTFYSCFYRTKLFPRIWHEVNGDGKTVHYSPYDGQVHDGPLYADTGFWDTYRTQFPIMTLLEPDRHSEILQGFVNAYHESGWLPQWPSPGHRVCMPGTHLDVTFADAVAKGLADFDVPAALEGMVKHANNPVGDGPYGAGRDNIQEYLDHGYVLATSHASVSQSLDYAYDDWCIGQVATALGRNDVAEQMNARADNYKKLWDGSVGFMRARHADGSWLTPFDPIGWGGPYCEGGPWQSSWAVQHDPEGLIELIGGPAATVAKLDEMLSSPPRFNSGDYSQEIHEITEMAVADFGQYAHSNQPVHHVLGLYAYAGRPDRMQFETRRVLEEYYKPLTLPGDEDNGEMCAWYVFCALGIYPFCPGRAEYVLTSPLFSRAVVSLPSGVPLEVVAKGTGRYVSSVRLNGRLIEGFLVSHSELSAGGVLEFEMSLNGEGV
ncbi:MAG TPA: glycoside hydrolase family 92 protein, partial [Fimbriimonas sp.]|nr:glycoside hydrolase family 92 protein [Fimbriimonas sp.]